MSLQTRLSDLITSIGTDYKQLRTWLTGSSSGDLTGLATTDKTNIVSAINEVNATAASATVPDASTTVKGKVELATLAEVGTGTDTVRAVTPEGVRQERIAVKAEILGAGVPAALDTLDELAAALADDANFSATVATGLANRVRVDTAAQGLTATEKANARTNIDVYSKTELGDPETDLAAQTRLSALITAVGADVKALQARTPTILRRVTAISDISEPANAVEWWTTSAPSLVAKLIAMNPIESSVIVDRTELWARVKSRSGGSAANRLILDSDGKSDFFPSVVTALPGTPYDGQEIFYLVSATNGIVWHLKYRAASASAYKWEYVGGQELRDFLANSESLGASNFNAYSNLATVGPQVTVPLAGEYLQTMELEMFNDGGVSSSNVNISFDRGATAAVDADSIQRALMNGGSGTGSRYMVPAIRRRLFTFTAGQLLTMKYKQNNPWTYFQNRAISVLPVRVG
jgi:hypothetical protein